MFKLSVGTTNNKLTDEDYRYLGARAEGFSGADIGVAVRDALMAPVRKVQTATHWKQVAPPATEDPHTTKRFFTPCSPGEYGGIEMNWMSLGPTDEVCEPAVDRIDMERALMNRWFIAISWNT